METKKLTKFDAMLASNQQQMAITGFNTGKLTAEEAAEFFIDATRPNTVLENRLEANKNEGFGIGTTGGNLAQRLFKSY